MELLLTLISLRIVRPAFPLSCKGAARDIQTNEINAKNNIADLFISLSSIGFHWSPFICWIIYLAIVMRVAA